MAPWSNCVVPLAVELGFFDIEGGHFGVGDFDTFFVGVPVKAAGDGHPFSVAVLPISATITR